MVNRISSTLVFCACIVGCEEPSQGRGDTMRWFVFDGHPEPTEEALGEVEEIFGLGIERAPEYAGAVTMFLPPEPLYDMGSLNHGAGWSCTAFVYVESDLPQVLAHELGHAYGLAHVDDPENLMFPEVGGLDLDDEQIDQVRSSIWYADHHCHE